MSRYPFSQLKIVSVMIQNRIDNFESLVFFISNKTNEQSRKNDTGQKSLPARHDVPKLTTTRCERK